MATMIRFFALCLSSAAIAASPYPAATPDTPANRALQHYWELRAPQMNTLASVRSASDWDKEESRRELREMLGLDPLPARTDLKATIVGEFTHEGAHIQKLHFQSMPGLYVTANFYRPAQHDGSRLPTILYVCGHAVVKKDGISYGNKVGYHHHGLWFAQHGYACLIIDTLQLGEIEGEHHGTHHLNKWWWIARGYTSAGVEAWNCIRALDYLETRPEVDAQRIGVTGRSGGGAYSWWIAALDDRIKVAAPTAGITSMKNHVPDGCIEGHCDCMFMVNTYAWDFDRVIALVAPRPLLICNTDRDPIFPIDGVFQLYTSARRFYGLLGKEDNIGLHIAEGPHKDVQPLNTGAFHWFERHLKGADSMVTTDGAAKKALEPEQLRVFTAGLPQDQINTKIDQSFVPMAKPLSPPASPAEWSTQRDVWMQQLTSKVFRSWPKNAPPVKLTHAGTHDADGVTMSAYDFTSQEPFNLRLYLTHRAGLRPTDLELIALHALDQQGWNDFASEYRSRFAQLIESDAKPNDEAFTNEKAMFTNFKWAMAYIAPRGIGPTAWTATDKLQTQRLRRFYLLGETLASGQAWDIRRTVQGLRSLDGLAKAKLWIASGGAMGINALYASLYEPDIARLDLNAVPSTHMTGPAYFNVLRYLDIPTATAMATERSKVVLYAKDQDPWQTLVQTAKAIGQERNVQLREPSEK
jgi:dienelactone hydrolase